jgi:hypothetical protein
LSKSAVASAGFGRWASCRQALLALALVSPLLAFADPLAIRTEPPDADKRAAFNTRWNVYLSGEFDPGATERVLQELAQIGDAGADVYLDSAGGSLAAGLQIGTLLRKFGANTSVGKPGSRTTSGEPGQCFSACSLAFLGGVYRYVPSGSVLGVHRAWTAARSDRDFDGGQIVAARISSYLKEMGIDAELFNLMVSVGKDQIHVLTPEELRALRVVNDGKQPAQWSSESTSEGPSLSGSQQSANGLGKATFVCSKGMMTFRSAYRAGASGASNASGDSTAAAIAGGQWAHTLLIDGDAIPLEAPTAIEAVDDVLNAAFVLSPDHVVQLAGATTTIGHAMQGSRSDPASLGYAIDIDAAAARKLRGFMEYCVAGR